MEGVILKGGGHAPGRGKYLQWSALRIVRYRVPSKRTQQTSAFAAPRATSRRCGLLLNYFGH